VSGLARLTSDNRFNSWPTFGDSNRQLFYLSMEPAFSKAATQLSSIWFDGSLLPRRRDLEQVALDLRPLLTIDPCTRRTAARRPTVGGAAQRPEEQRAAVLSELVAGVGWDEMARS
jgi:hypothetical protein